MSDKAETKGTPPCGLTKGEAYALGLSDGTCPVGVVAAGDEQGVTLVLFDWICCMFVADTIWVRADLIQKWLQAELTAGHEKDKVKDFWMDPLGEFQTEWTHTHAQAVPA